MNTNEYDQKLAFRQTARLILDQAKATSVINVLMAMTRGEINATGFQVLENEDHIDDDRYWPTIEGLVDRIEQNDAAETAYLMHQLIEIALGFASTVRASIDVNDEH